MKKILCLSDGLMQGGAERQLIGLSHYLQEQNYDVTLACYTDGIFYKDIISEYNLRFVLLTPKNNIISKIHCVYSLARKEEFDCVIAYKDGATSIACINKLLGLKYKLIVSERNTTQELNLKDKIKFLLYRCADYIVPNSYSQGDFVKRRYPMYKDKIHVITNFTDVSKFIPIKTKKNKECINILTVGRIAEQKNLFHYLNVVKRIVDEGENIKFRWVGTVSVGQDMYYKQCLEFINKNKLSGSFTFIPAKQNIKEEYDECDAFCLPSIYEGFPNVVCEAMACAKPILCSNVCDNPYIVDDSINGYLYNPLDEEDMYNKFKKFILLSNKERCVMGNNSRKLVEKKCSKEAFISKYIKLIESV